MAIRISTQGAGRRYAHRKGNSSLQKLQVTDWNNAAGELYN